MLGNTIHPAPVNSMVFAPNCFEANTLITSTSTIPQGSITSTTWTMDDPPVLYVGISVEHEFASPGFFPIVLETLSDQGCETMLTDTVEIWPLPLVSYALSDTVLCVNDPVQLTNTSTIPEPYANVSWQWFINGALAGTAPELSTTFDPAGSYTVGLVVTSGNGCVDSLFNAQQIMVHPLPVAGFLADPTHTGILQPEIQVLDTSFNSVQWGYDFGDGAYSFLQNPANTYATFGSYVIEQIVTSVHGCLDTAYQQVVIDPDLLIYVPNTFTPDGDGVNDVFLPSLDGFRGAGVQSDHLEPLGGVDLRDGRGR
ncbi:MAG: PKD domain-containing protein [Flavobacteriales bacterium]|nr:PKD domain-containing protein [Flavobacteriales bacterium]